MNTVSPLISFEGLTVAGALETRARLTPDARFLAWAPFEGAGRTWTYREFSHDVSCIAAGLVARGVKEGDKIAVFLENCPECLLTWFACTWIGAVCMPINAAWTAEELAYPLGLAKVKGIITQPRLLATVQQAVAPSQWVIVTETDGGTLPQVVPVRASAFDSLRERPLMRAEIAASSPCCVMFTSGTTSRPKGVVWTHTNVLWAAKLGAMQEGLTASDTYLVFLPLFHVVALNWSVLTTLWAGGVVVLQPRFSASRFWNTAIAYQCTWASMVPFCTAVLARQPIPEQHFFRCWGHAVYDPAYEKLFRLKLLGWWGMTELLTQGIVGDLAMPQTAKSIGRPSLGYDIVVLDDEGNTVGPGVPGDLRIRGKRGVSIFLEYLDDEVATREAFDEQGYFRTGDRVVVQPDGAITFVERAKDIIKVGGENVSASEVEQVVQSLPGIREAAVVSQADPILGEVPVVFVVLDANASTDESERVEARVVRECQGKLAKFKVPRRVVIIEEMPRISIAKISKPKLKALLT